MKWEVDEVGIDKVHFKKSKNVMLPMRTRCRDAVDCVIDGLAIICSMYSEKLIERLWDGLESSIYIDGFWLRRTLNCQLLQMEQGSFDHFALCPLEGSPPHELFESILP